MRPCCKHAFNIQFVCLGVLGDLPATVIKIVCYYSEKGYIARGENFDVIKA